MTSPGVLGSCVEMASVDAAGVVDASSVSRGSPDVAVSAFSVVVPSVVETTSRVVPVTVVASLMVADAVVTSGNGVVDTVVTPSSVWADSVVTSGVADGVGGASVVVTDGVVASLVGVVFS